MLLGLSSPEVIAHGYVGLNRIFIVLENGRVVEGLLLLHHVLSIVEDTAVHLVIGGHFQETQQDFFLGEGGKLFC